MAPKKGLVLDAGCGRAKLSEVLLKKENLKIIGCDTGPSSQLKNESFEYRQIDIDEGFKFKEKFDTIIFADVLEHLKKPKKILKEASMNTDKFIISIPNLNFFLYRIFPKMEQPPKGESQHLHHWELKEFLKILPEEFKVVKKKYCTDFPEFRWSNYLFPGISFFHQTIVMEVVRK